MRSFVLGLVATLAFAGTSSAQTNSARSVKPEILRSTSSSAAQKQSTKTAAKPVTRPATVQKVAAQRPGTVAQRTVTKQTSPQQLRAARYGGFAPVQPLPPPELDLTSPRTLNLLNVNTQEAISVTFWSDGTYRRDALDKLNHFLRDWRTQDETVMDRRLFDILWEVYRDVDGKKPIQIISSYRSPATNSRGVRGDAVPAGLGRPTGPSRRSTAHDQPDDPAPLGRRAARQPRDRRSAATTSAIPSGHQGLGRYRLSRCG